MVCVLWQAPDCGLVSLGSILPTQSDHYFDMLSLLAQIGAIPGRSAESAGA